MTSPIRLAHVGPVAVLTLARPAARNALSLEVIKDLISAFAAIEANPAVRVVVLEAEGPAFSAGHDLKELSAHRSDEDRGRTFFEATFSTCSVLNAAHCRSATAGDRSD